MPLKPDRPRVELVHTECTTERPETVLLIEWGIVAQWSVSLTYAPHTFICLRSLQISGASFLSQSSCVTKGRVKVAYQNSNRE